MFPFLRRMLIMLISVTCMVSGLAVCKAIKLLFVMNSFITMAERLLWRHACLCHHARQTTSTDMGYENGNCASCWRHSSSFFDYVVLIDQLTTVLIAINNALPWRRFICFTEEMVAQLMPLIPRAESLFTKSNYICCDWLQGTSS